jgi:hypothetical protein
LSGKEIKVPEATDTRAPSWRIIALVSEPAILLQAFVAHWLSWNPTGITLFMDEPDPTVAALLRAADPRVEVVGCDAAFWAGFDKGRFWQPSWRQMAVLQRACDTAEEDWILHVDADEMLSSERPVPDLLAEAGPEITSVFLPVTERVHIGRVDPGNIFDGVFRRPTPGRLEAEVAAIDGPLGDYFDRGMTGYASGKSFFRARAGLRVGIHAPNPVLPERRLRLQDAELLHFDGLTARHFARKKWRTMAQQPKWREFPRPARVLQLEETRATRGWRRAEARFYARLKVLSEDRAAALDALGLLSRQGFDPRPDLARWFPGQRHDLRVKAFDRTRIRWAPRVDGKTPLPWPERMAEWWRSRG